MRRTRLLIKPKVGPLAAGPAARPVAATTSTCTQSAPFAVENATAPPQSLPSVALVKQSSAGTSENGMQSTPTTPTAPVDQAAKCDNMRVTSELMTPINAEEKPITRIKRAGPRIPPPKPSKPHTNAPLTPKNTPASTLTLPESVVENVFAPHVETSSKADTNCTKERAEEEQIAVIETVHDDIHVDKASLSREEKSAPKFAEPAKKQRVPKVSRSHQDQNDSDPLASLPSRLERKAARKANEFREMLIASRRKFAKVKEPVDTSKLTMLDLIYYNPPGAPMTRHKNKLAVGGKDKELGRQNGSIGGDLQESLEPELEDESTRDSAQGSGAGGDVGTPPQVEAGDNEEEEVIGPRVVVGADGSIQIDEASLVIRRPNPEEQRHNLKVTVEEPGKTKYDSFKTKKTKKCTWTTRETSKFYRALSICGTDFTLMTQFFPTRSRQDLKNKFKREEKSNPSLVDKAIHHPTQFEYTEGELEDISKDEEDEPVIKKPREPRSAKTRNDKVKETGKGGKAKGTSKRGKKKTKEEPPDKNEGNNDLAEGDRSDSDEVGFRNGIIEDALARTRRKRAKVDYAEMNEGAPDSFDDEGDRDLEVVEEDTAADNYVMLDEAALTTPFTQPIQQSTSQNAHALAAVQPSVPSTQPVVSAELSQSIVTTISKPSESTSPVASPDQAPLPEPPILPPGLEPGQLVLFAPRDGDKALHFFVVNPPLTNNETSPVTADSTVVPAEGHESEVENPSLSIELDQSVQAVSGESNAGSSATMPSQPSSMQVVSVEKRPSILQDQVFSEKSYSNETFHGVPPSLAEETLPEVTFKSVKKEESRTSQSTAQGDPCSVVISTDDIDTSTNQSHDATSPARIAEHVAEEHSTGDRESVQNASDTSHFNITAASSAKKSLPKVVFRSRAKRGSVPPTTASDSSPASGDTQATTMDESSTLAVDTAPEPRDASASTHDRSLVSSLSEDTPSKEASNPNISNANVVKNKKPAILSRRRTPLLRKPLSVVTKMSEPLKVAPQAEKSEKLTATGEILANEEVLKDEPSSVDSLTLRNSDLLISNPKETNQQNYLEDGTSLQTSKQMERTTEGDPKQAKVVSTASNIIEEKLAADTDTHQPSSSALSNRKTIPENVTRTDDSFCAIIEEEPKTRRSSRRVVTPVAPASAKAISAVKATLLVKDEKVVSETHAESADVAQKQTTTSAPQQGAVSSKAKASTEHKLASTVLSSTPMEAGDYTTPKTLVQQEQPQDPTATVPPAAARIEADITNLLRVDFEKTDRSTLESPKAETENPITRSSPPRSQSSSVMPLVEPITPTTSKRRAASSGRTPTAVDNEKDLMTSDDTGSSNHTSLEQNKILQKPSSLPLLDSPLIRPSISSGHAPARAQVILPRRKASAHVVRPIGAPVARSTVLTPVTIRRPQSTAHQKGANK